MNIPPASKTSASTCRASACCGKRSCTTTRTSAASGCGCRMTGNASRSDLDCGGYAAAFLHLENIVILRRGDARRISKCETFAYLEILRCLTQLRMTMLRVVRCGKAAALAAAVQRSLPPKNLQPEHVANDTPRDEETDAGKGPAAEETDQREEQHRAADAYAEEDPRERDEDSDFVHEKRHARQELRKKVVTLAHRRCDQTLEKFSQTRVDDGEADAPH